MRDHVIHLNRRVGCSPKRFLFYHLPLWGYAAVIFCLSSLPLDSIDLGSDFQVDKLLHLVEYYGLGYLLMRCFCTSPNRSLSGKAVLWTVLAGVGYAVSDEFHQSFTPGRDANVADALFDAAGIVIAAFTFSIVRHSIGIVRAFERRIETEVNRP